MTTTIMGRVWIEWPTDPGMPWGWRIYLEGSTRPMDDVLAMQISMEVHGRTVVDLRRTHSAGIERYELIAGHYVRPDVKYSAKPTRMVADAIRNLKRKQCASCEKLGKETTRCYDCPESQLRRELPFLDFGGTKKCDECGGSGWYQGFNSRQPCSRGCRP